MILPQRSVRCGRIRDFPHLGHFILQTSGPQTCGFNTGCSNRDGMESDAQKDAWEKLYSSQGRPWRGVADIRWTGIAPGTRVLDLGCGNGKTSEALLEAGCAVVGADFSEAAVESCRKLLGHRAEFVAADCRDLPFPDGSFGAVAAVHVLEHVPRPDLEKAVSEMLRVTAPGGRICIRCFAEGDMRSGGEKESVRNGILYRYFSEDELRGLLRTEKILSLEHIDEPTRFGTVRRRMECVAERTVF